STLLRVIAGLEDPDRGQVLLGDEDVTHRPARARGVGMVFQHYAAFKHMTVWENVAFGLKVRKRGKDEIQKRVSELLELVQLDGDSTEAMVERVVHLGFEVRAELVRDDGQHLLAQLTQEEAQELELERGLIVYVRPSRQTVFTP